MLVFSLCTEGVVKCDDVSHIKLHYFNGDYNQANDLFRNISWVNELAGANVNEMWRFLCRYTEVVRRCIPAKATALMGSRTKPKWTTLHMIEQVNRKEKAWEHNRKRRTKIRYEHY